MFFFFHYFFMYKNPKEFCLFMIKVDSTFLPVRHIFLSSSDAQESRNPLALLFGLRKSSYPDRTKKIAAFQLSPAQTLL